MCSSKKSDTTYRLSNGRTLCAPTEAKILCRTSFRSGRRSLVCVRLRNKREMGVKRVETAGVYPLAHCRGYGGVPLPGRQDPFASKRKPIKFTE